MPVLLAFSSEITNKEQDILYIQQKEINNIISIYRQKKKIWSGPTHHCSFCFLETGFSNSSDAGRLEDGPGDANRGERRS